SVLSAYAPIQVGSRNWAILAEIDKAEAFAAADQLSRQLLTIAAAICAVLIALAAGVGVWFAGSLSRPILKLSGTIGEIERESDLTRQVDIRSQDELGMVANAFNTMVVKFRDSIRQVADATSQLAATAEETSVITQQTSQTAQSQQAETAQVATAMTEMNATVQEVANNTQITSQAASDVTREAIQGRQAMEQTVEQIQQLADEVEKAAEVVGGLEKNSQEIGAVLDVIKGIAEQTNLLALNAAIEAARAGEQGRGFAVVADEVRTLASRTQQSTEEINKMIEKLQVGSRQAVTAMGQSREKTQQAVKQALETGQSLSTITAAIERINDMSTQIASAAEEQSAVTGEISRNIVQISEMTEQTAVGAQQTSEASVELSRLANGLQALVARFKIQASADC
ncbi:MAG TPA: methyl-accepting chemotaxis protein, partial [Gammaproteobacteria bacterium]|nr:methyl-accepting chemotaxis protein [Gammaproteobacteria bacterium]